MGPWMMRCPEKLFGCFREILRCLYVCCWGVITAVTKSRGARRCKCAGTGRGACDKLLECREIVLDFRKLQNNNRHGSEWWRRSSAGR